MIKEILRKTTRAVRGEVSTKRLIKNGLKVGENYSRQANVRLDPSYPFLITIGNNVTMAPNVTILAHDASLKNHLGITKTAPVVVEDDVFIGANSIVLCGVKIGKKSIVGAGAVVTKDIPEGEVWAGNPAKFIMTIDEYMSKTMMELNDDNIIDTPQLKTCWVKNRSIANVIYQKCDNYRKKENVRNKYSGKQK